VSQDSEERPPLPQRPPALERLLRQRQERSAEADQESPQASDSAISSSPAGSTGSGQAVQPARDEAATADSSSLSTSQIWELENLRTRLDLAQEELADLRHIESSHQRLLALLEANAALLVSGDPQQLPARVLEIALDLVGAERAAFFRLNAEGTLQPSLVRPSGTSFNAISQSVVRDALIGRRSVIYQGRATREGFERQSILDLDLETVVATPLLAEETLLGVLYIDGTQAGRFGEADLPVLEVFSRLAAAGMQRLEELRQTREEKQLLELENRELKSALSERTQFGRILASSQSMKRVVEQLRRMCRYRTTVRIFGETGTGKELIARALHTESPWADKPFIAINCGAIPENLLEAELFGYMKGAFTGAVADKRGLFEEAQNGSLFLDEIGDMSFHLQAKLLRVLELGEIRRVGGTKDFKVDVRIIAASHQDLEALVESGKFREDLFYRLNALTVKLPPLRERPEDIALLAEHFLDTYSQRMQLERPRLGAGAIQVLQAQRWPGNVRQLEKCIERSLALSSGGEVMEAQEILLDDDPLGPREPLDPARGPANESLRAYVLRHERAKIGATLRAVDWKVTEAAKRLGISRQYLHRKIRDLDLRRE
jgi:transcriptional regulator with PAS, ATPase and Fis domain